MCSCPKSSAYPYHDRHIGGSCIMACGHAVWAAIWIAVFPLFLFFLPITEGEESYISDCDSSSECPDGIVGTGFVLFQEFCKDTTRCWWVCRLGSTVSTNLHTNRWMLHLWNKSEGENSWSLNSDTILIRTLPLILRKIPVRLFKIKPQINLSIEFGVTRVPFIRILSYIIFQFASQTE